MTVVYVDALFLLNGLVDYLLLLAAARIAGEPLCRVRFGLAAVLGGCYAVALFLPGLGFLEQWPCRLAAAALMLLVAYGRSKCLMRQAIIFFALTCALGGGIVFLKLFWGNSQQNALAGRVGIYEPVDVKTILLSSAFCYVCLSTVFQRAGKHLAATGELVSARLHLEDRSLELTALVDTGNRLTDPVSGQMVMVAEGNVLAPLFPKEYRPRTGDLQDPVKGLERLGNGKWRGRFRLLPYRSVGVENGILLAVKIDSLTLNGKQTGVKLVALSPTEVSDGGGYRALVGALE